VKLLPLFLFLFLGCTSSVKLTEVKLPPKSEYFLKPVEIEAKTKGAYQQTCTKNGELYQWQSSQWEKIDNDLNPLESFTPYLMNDVYYPATAVGEGCDMIDCLTAYSSVSFDLAKYKQISEKPNPKYTGKPKDEYGNEIPKMIPNYRATLLSGRFKAKYIYYTDVNCTQTKVKEIEFEVP
jgi:hypothetical protein